MDPLSTSWTSSHSLPTFYKFSTVFHILAFRRLSSSVNSSGNCGRRGFIVCRELTKVNRTDWGSAINGNALSAFLSFGHPGSVHSNTIVTTASSARGGRSLFPPPIMSGGRHGALSFRTESTLDGRVDSVRTLSNGVSLLVYPSLADADVDTDLRHLETPQWQRSPNVPNDLAQCTVLSTKFPSRSSPEFSGSLHLRAPGTACTPSWS